MGSGDALERFDAGADLGDDDAGTVFDAVEAIFVFLRGEAEDGCVDADEPKEEGGWGGSVRLLHSCRKD